MIFDLWDEGSIDWLNLGLYFLRQLLSDWVAQGRAWIYNTPASALQSAEITDMHY